MVQRREALIAHPKSTDDPGSATIVSTLEETATKQRCRPKLIAGMDATIEFFKRRCKEMLEDSSDHPGQLTTFRVVNKKRKNVDLSHEQDPD